MDQTQQQQRQRGDIPVGQLLVIGLIVIPLVIMLVIFRVEIYTWFIDRWVDLVTTPSEPGW